MLIVTYLVEYERCLKATFDLKSHLVFCHGITFFLSWIEMYPACFSFLTRLVCSPSPNDTWKVFNKCLLNKLVIDSVFFLNRISIPAPTPTTLFLLLELVKVKFLKPNYLTTFFETALFILLLTRANNMTLKQIDSVKRS